jgi:hypothetical protein
VNYYFDCNRFFERRRRAGFLLPWRIQKPVNRRPDYIILLNKKECLRCSAMKRA